MSKFINFKGISSKILNLINLHPDENQAPLLVTAMIVGLIGTYTSPTFVKVVISALPAQWISIQALVSVISGFIVSIIWKGKIRRSAIKYFIILIAAESLCGFALGLYLAFIEWNVWVYAIFSLIYSSLITEFVSNAVMAFKSRLWVDKKREQYDNNRKVVSSITAMIGFALAIVVLPSLKVCLVLFSISCIFDDLGWFIVYRKNKEKLQAAADEDIV